MTLGILMIILATGLIALVFYNIGSGYAIEINILFLIVEIAIFIMGLVVSLQGEYLHGQKDVASTTFLKLRDSKIVEMKNDSSNTDKIILMDSTQKELFNYLTEILEK